MKRVLLVALLGLALAFSGAAAEPKSAIAVSIFSQDVGTLDPDFAVGTQDRAPVALDFQRADALQAGTIDPEDAGAGPGAELGGE